MKIIKRNGTEVAFDISKIVMAISKANIEVDEKVRLTPVQIDRIAESVEVACEEMGRSPSVEEIQDLVEKAIMSHGAFEVAKEYITYRYTRNLLRQSNTTDDRILSLIECNNEEVKQENANKNPTINAVQRDYMAGEVSKDITSRILLPRDIVAAHEAGIIHFHDSDYYAQHMHNCDLINLDDMLQNGTVISGTLIEKPHSFSTACNIATQIIAQVASNQYGGQSISLTHLAPFVQISREKIRKSVQKEMETFGVTASEEAISKVVEDRLRDEVRNVKPDRKTALEKVSEAAERREQQAKKTGKAVHGILVAGLSNCLVKFSRCCTPVPGDDIIGFITRGQGVSIHRRDCANCRRLLSQPGNEGRFVDVEWAGKVDDSYQTTVVITAKDRSGIVLDIAAVLNVLNAKVRTLSARDNGAGTAVTSVTLEVKDAAELKYVMNRLSSIQGVISVARNGD